jgi:hypothetical protein
MQGPDTTTVVCEGRNMHSTRLVRLAESTFDLHLLTMC